MEDITLTSFIVRVTGVLLLVAANAFFVAAEFSLVASRRTRIETWARRGDLKAKLALKAIQSIDRYISATQLGITVASLGLGWIGEPAVAGAISAIFHDLPAPLDAIATHAVAGTIAFLIITFLHIVLGELAPKALALLHPEATSRWVVAPLMGFTVATNPFIWVLNGTANGVLRMFGMRAPSEAERVHRPEEIVMLARQSQRSGHLDKGDLRMLEGVFEFTEKNVSDVMTPRTDMIALPSNLTIADAVDHVSQSRRSRYPVYGESPDDVVGVVHIKDILGALAVRGRDTVASIAREPLFVPGTREVEDVLADMQRLKAQMAVVLDEYGGTAGIVTMEDLLEEIVGEIYDEYDHTGPKAQPVGDGLTVPGDMEIEDLNERYGLAISDEDYLTIGGFVFGALGRLPKVGDRVTTTGARFEVLTMDGRRVGTLRLVKADGQKTTEQSGTV
jgi:CBS domain containing-hemolysin-like protein